MSEELANLLAHPLRAQLLYEYHQPTSPSKLARRLGARVNVVSYHTNVLLEHGWIELVATERRRGAIEHFYRATSTPVIEDVDWPRISPQLRRAVVLGLVGVTRDEVRSAALQGGFDGPAAHLSRSPLELDEEGVAAVAATLRDVIARLDEIAASARERGPAGRDLHEVIIQYFRVARGED